LHKYKLFLFIYSFVLVLVLIHNFVCAKVPAVTTAVAAPQTSVSPAAVPSVVSGAPTAVTPPTSSQGPPLPIQVVFTYV
jgi:hypothetical protein